MSGKFNTLKLMLAMLYIDNSGEIIEPNYKEIKFFIGKILDLRCIELKLKYFYLTIKLLEKVEADRAEPHFNKEFVGALGLLKKFVTENKYIPNETDLKYVSGLGRE